MNGATHTTREVQSTNIASEDEEKREKIKEIIDHQFDLEIYLKYREISAIREEIGKAEELLSDIRLAVHNDIIAATSPEAHHNTRRSALQAIVANKSFPLPSLSLPLQYDANQRNARASSKFSSDQSSKWLFGRRADGVYVSLACPRCHRDDFANQQGFLNHCRLAHGLEFGPYENMVKQCGTPVDESDVPLDHPIRLRPITKPLSITSIKKANVKRPTIKVFEEDVVLDSDDEENALVLPNREDSDSKDAQSQDDRSNASTPKNQQFKSEPGDNTQHDLHSIGENAKETGANSPLNSTSQDSTIKQEKTEAGNNQMESISVVVNPHVSEHGSRFYIKRRVIVGNVSKFIPQDKREPGLRQYTHKWMIYVTTPHGAEDISSFLSCVRYHLHPSYKPNDVIDVAKPPFHLTRLGWGEFPIRVQLHFVDSRRNKLVDVFHQLKLDYSHSGQQTLGSERYIELELDRNTEFIDPKTAIANGNVTDGRNDVIGQVVQRRDPLDDLMRDIVPSFPIIRSQVAAPNIQPMPYACAPTTNMYFDYHVGHRKALEWHRSRAFRLAVQKIAAESNDAVLKQAADGLTTKKCVLWCRENGFTPAKSQATSIGKPAVHNIEEEIALGYCKFCGTLRALHTYDTHVTDEACQYRPKGWSYRKRTGGISSVTSILPLLQKLGKGWDQVKEQDDMEVEIDQPTLSNGAKEAAQTVDPRTIQLIENVRSVETDRILEDPDHSCERTLDWIWATIDQLRLQSVIANDIVQTRYGEISTKDERCNLEDAIDQRLIAGTVLYQATKAFLGRVVKSSVEVYRKETSTDNATVLPNNDKIEPSKRKLLVPHHVYQCLQKEDQFDFLTNKHLNLEETTENSEEI